MWYMWSALLLVSCALGANAEAAAVAVEPAPVATTHAPPRTLDRQAAELAWKSWLQSPESGNPNAPPRRITTKSLFITPLVCPKGQRLDRNGCVQVVTVNKDEHERILLEHLNALFTAPPSGDVVYDYGDDEPGPLQLSIPIGLDPQAAPLQGQEPSAQAQDLNYVNVDKKDENKPESDASVEAELELLKLQNTLNSNKTTAVEGSDDLNNNALANNNGYHPDKPKRDSPVVNETELELPSNTTDQGQKELVFGHVNVDPVIFNTENVNEESVPHNVLTPNQNNTTVDKENNGNLNKSDTSHTETPGENSTIQLLKTAGDQSKLNPENDYSDIGEAIKLISRYADVTTDDNFAKEQNKFAIKQDSILGTRTRTKLQYRRNKPKEDMDPSAPHAPLDISNADKQSIHKLYSKNEAYYRYPWSSQHSQTPPPDYPFRHLQDYWPGRNQIGGVYNTHENPRRHHHSYPHNFRPHGYPNAGYAGVKPAYPEQLKNYVHRALQRHASPSRPLSNNRDLYSLLGLRHWFSSEGTSDR